MSELEKGFPYWNDSTDLLSSSSPLVLRARRLARRLRNRLAKVVINCPRDNQSSVCLERDMKAGMGT